MALSGTPRGQTDEIYYIPLLPGVQMDCILLSALLQSIEVRLEQQRDRYINFQEPTMFTTDCFDEWVDFRNKILVLSRGVEIPYLL